jgi:hypothetical protein
MKTRYLVAAIIGVFLIGIGLWALNGQDTHPVEVQDVLVPQASSETREEGNEMVPEQQGALRFGIDWRAPDLAGTLVTIDSASLHSVSKNPTLTGTAKGFSCLNISVISRDRDGGLVSNRERIPVVDERWSVVLEPEKFSYQASQNVFSESGEVPNGTYNIQMFPCPLFMSSLVNATLVVDAP